MTVASEAASGLTRIAFTVPGPPRGKQRAGRMRMKNGSILSFNPGKTAVYENLVLLCYREAARGRLPHDGPVSIAIVSRHPIPASWSARRRARAVGQPCTSKPDMDNILKTVADALNKVAWTDDSRITTATIEKRYAEKPGLAIVIEYNEGLQMTINPAQTRTESQP